MRKFLIRVVAAAIALMVAGPARPATNDRPEPYSETNPATTVGPQLPRQSARPQQLPQQQPVPARATPDEGGGSFDWACLACWDSLGCSDTGDGATVRREAAIEARLK
jgi:hypothetical protein